MARDETTHHLLVPSLLKTWPEPVPEPPRLPHLERLLARADRLPAPAGYADTLFELFRIPMEQRAVAPFRWFGLGLEPVEGWVMRADPVHFRADRDQLLLFPLPEHDLTQEETAAFIEAFNHHFTDEGLELRAPDPRHWFLLLEKPPEADFTDLEKAQGRSLDQSMPRGAGAAFWKRLMNETQMLFFSLGVNEERQRRGALAVNGLWFSAPGQVVPETGTAPLFSGDSRECLLHGLLRAAVEVDERNRLTLVPGVEEAWRRQDADAWQETLNTLESLLAELCREEATLILHPCGGQAWRWERSHRLRLWRRAKPYRSFTA